MGSPEAKTNTALESGGTLANTERPREISYMPGVFLVPVELAIDPSGQVAVESSTGQLVISDHADRPK